MQQFVYATPATQGFAWQSRAPRRSQHLWAMTWQVHFSPNHTELSQSLLGRGLSCDRAKLHLRGPHLHNLQATMLTDHMLQHTVGKHQLLGSTAMQFCSAQLACCLY